MQVQKALHLHIEQEKKNPKYLYADYIVTEKFDGWYMYADWNFGVLEGIFSSNGRRIPSMAGYERLMQKVKAPTSGRYRLIFEAYIEGMAFAEMNGMFNQKHTELNCVKFMCHDFVCWEKKEVGAMRRYINLQVFLDINKSFDFLHLVPILVTSPYPDEWMVHYENVLKKPNGEGVILKHAHAPYWAGKRNYTLMKIKCDLTLDLLVTGVVKGKGKYENTLGALIVKGTDGIEHQISGMADSARDLWYSEPSLIIGKVVEVQAMKKLANGSLREPRFKAIRYDKTEKDID